MTTHTPGPWNKGQAKGQHVPTPQHGYKSPCANCTIEWDNRFVTQELVLCPLHASAPEMLALLKTVPPISGSDAQTEMEWNWKLQALLAKIEGKAG